MNIEQTLFVFQISYQDIIQLYYIMYILPMATGVGACAEHTGAAARRMT